jgi:non-ribosomal peptide synthetase component F
MPDNGLGNGPQDLVNCHQVNAWRARQVITLNQVNGIFAENQIEPLQRLSYPCTLQQQRFWVLEQLKPGNPALNVAVRWELEGEVRSDLIDRSWQTVIARHETLRTSISEIDGEPIQIVESSVKFRVPLIDLTMLPEETARAEADRIAGEEARTAIDLHCPPLIRVTHLRLTPTRSIILVTAHHIICDGWSIGRLAAEVGTCYAALHAGQEPALPLLPLQYGEFAAWQRSALAADDVENSLPFWRNALAGMRHFEIPTDHPRPSIESYNGSIVSELLERDITDGITSVARGENCSLFTVALAALLTLLHRHSDETDIAIGTQITGRDTVELENLVGLFINTLVIRADLSGDPTFVALISRVKAVVNGIFEHQAVPLQKLIDIVAPARDLSRNPLFSVNFIFQRSFITNAAYGGFRLIDLPSRSAGALYDLNFFMVERPEGWRISCEYNTDLFEKATVAGFLQRLTLLLKSAASTPGSPISKLEILSPAERDHLMNGGNLTDKEYPADKPVHQLFTEQAERTPAAIALIVGNETLTYAILAKEVTGFTNRLRQHGVSRGDRIGVALHRSSELIISVLGILRLGAAYVPLDSTLPYARLTQILESANLKLLVTRSNFLTTPMPPSQDVLLFEKPRKRCVEYAESLELIRPDDLAYVIYTSGTTGRPKGVEISHRSLTNLLCAMQETPGFDATDVLLAVTTVSFDIAALEIFLPLISGGRVVLAQDHERTDGNALRRLLRRHHVTTMQATPATWRLLLEAGGSTPQDVMRRRGSSAIARQCTLGKGRRIMEHVRSDRNHDLVVGGADHPRRRTGTGRTAYREHAVLHSEPKRRLASARNAGRIVHWW